MTASILVVAAAAGILSGPAAARDQGSRARGAGVVTVRLGEYFYRPARLTIRVGQTVRFVNVGKIEHTVADTTRSGAIRGRTIRPRPLARGASQTVRFGRRGTVYYRCTFHPSLMRGVIVVR